MPTVNADSYVRLMYDANGNLTSSYLDADIDTEIGPVLGSTIVNDVKVYSDNGPIYHKTAAWPDAAIHQEYNGGVGVIFRSSGSYNPTTLPWYVQGQDLYIQGGAQISSPPPHTGWGFFRKTIYLPDQFVGADGNDTISGIGTLRGYQAQGSGTNSDNDTEVYYPVGDLIWGNGGNDTLTGLDGDDRLIGGADNDVLDGGNHNDDLWGGAGNDVLEGGLGRDYLWGGAGDDVLYTGALQTEQVRDRTTDFLIGGSGKDTFVIGDNSLRYGVDSSVDLSTGANYVSAAINAIEAIIGLTSIFVPATKKIVDFAKAGINGYDAVNNLIKGSQNEEPITAVLNETDIAATITDFNPLEDNIIVSLGQNLSVDPTTGLLTRANVEFVKSTFDDTAFTIVDKGGVIDIKLAHVQWTGLATMLPEYVNTQNGNALDGLRDAVIDTHLIVQKDRVIVNGSGDSSMTVDQLRAADPNFTQVDSLNDLGEDEQLLFMGAMAGRSYSGTDAAEHLFGTSKADGLAGYQIGIAGEAHDNAGDVFYGFGGTDTFFTGAGTNIVFGGDDTDTASYQDADYVTVNLSANATIDLQTDIEGGSSGNSVSTQRVSTAATTYSYGRADARYSDGGATSTGFDRIYQVENVDGSQDNDTITGDGAANRLRGGIGNDTLIGMGNNDVLDGGSGSDVAGYGSSTGGVTVNLTAGTALGPFNVGSDTLISIENVVGSDHNDVLIGNAAANTLEGGLGDDRLEGRGENDRLDGGAGFDTASYENASSGVSVNLAAGTALGPFNVGSDVLVSIENAWGSAHNDVLIGNADNNYLSGLAGDDSLTGEAGLDVLEGGAGNDTLFGGANDDVLRGAEGSDELFGGANNDFLEGGADDDTLDAGAGTDTMTGGTGVDTFVLTGGNGTGDRILDFGAVGGAMRSDGVVRMDKIKIITSDATLTKSDILLGASYFEDGREYQDLYIPKLETGGSDAFERVKIHFTSEFFTRKTESQSNNVPSTLQYLRDQIDIVSVADTLTAIGDTAVMAEDGPAISIDVLNNDLVTDANHILTLQSVTTPTNGTAEVVDDQVRYTPNADYHGTDTFSYTMTDTAGASATGSVSVTVSPVKDSLTGLTLSNDSIQENQDGAVIGTLAVNDPDGDRRVDFVVRGATHLFEVDGNQLKLIDGVSLDFDGDYSPPNAQSGYNWLPDQKALYFQISAYPYRTTDIGTEVIDYPYAVTDWYTISITEDPFEAAPVAVNDTFTITEEQTGDGPLGANLLDVLANDSDPDSGDELKVVGVTSPAPGLGTAFVNNGQLYFDTLQDLNGTTSFDYTVEDRSGNQTTATVDLTINNTNDAPIALNDFLVVAEDTPVAYLNVILNDLDIDPGDGIRVDRIVSDPSNGRASASSATSVAYTPNENFYGTDSFTYLIYDNANASSTATVTITVTPQDDAPNAVNDSFTVTEDTTANVLDVLANDVEVDGEVLTVTAISSASNGTATLTDSAITYTPNSQYAGNDSFTYTVQDEGGNAVTRTVNLTVQNAPDAPVAINDLVFVTEDSGENILNVTSNDIDIDPGDTPTVSAVGNAANGQVTVDNGTVRYRPNDDFFGSDSFSYTLTDADGLTATATVSVIVNGVNDRPSAPQLTLAPETLFENAEGVEIGTLSATDADGDDLTFLVNEPDRSPFEIVNGTTFKLKDGVSLDYETDANFFTGEASWAVRVRDAAGEEVSANLRIPVSDVNEVPGPITLDNSAINENVTGGEIGTIGGGVDQDRGDAVTFTVDDGRFEVASGVLKLKGGVALDHELAEIVDLTVTATDQSGLTSTLSRLITVNDVNEAPTALAIENIVPAGMSFFAESYARFDDLFAGQWQRVYDFGNGAGDNNILFGQLARTNGVRFEVLSGDTSLGVLDIPNVLVAGETAKWTTQVSDAGLMQVFKNDVLVGESQAGGPAPDVARSNLLVGHSNWPGDDALIGEVISLEADLDGDRQLDFFGGTGQPGTEVVENTAPGTVIGTVRVVGDPDAGETYSYTTDDARIEVVNGELRIAPGASFDFETMSPNPFTVTVTATDASNTHSVSAQKVISVLDANEAPTAIALSANTVSENAAGAVIGVLSVTDEDAGDNHSYAVSDTRFEVDGPYLKLNDGISLDFEAGTPVQVTVTATDSGQLSVDQSFDITVTDVEETPVANNDVYALYDTAIPLLANDTDGDGDPLSFTKINGIAVPGTFDPIDGFLRLGTAQTVGGGTVSLLLTGNDATDQTTWTLGAFGPVVDALGAGQSDELRVTYGIQDSTGRSASAEVVITLNGINNAPSGITLSSNTVSENAAGAVIGTLGAIDPDTGDSFT